MLGPMSQMTDRLSWLRTEMDQLFEDLLPGWTGATSTAGGSPALNLWEDDTSFYLEAELPGLKIDDLELAALDRQFTIRGERKPDMKEGWTCHRQERSSGTFARTIEFPIPVDADQVQASFKHGVLTVTLPKAESAKPRKIDVKRIEKK
jgi:HSP20 family protein